MEGKALLDLSPFCICRKCREKRGEDVNETLLYVPSKEFVQKPEVRSKFLRSLKRTLERLELTDDEKKSIL